ncbi:MAG: acyl-CoA thioesterase [Faecalibacterium sp.]
MFVYRRKAQYHETDQMGIIHHANYLKWMEEARVGFMDQMGLGYKEVEQYGIVSPVAGISVDYKKPVHFADEVEIRVWVKRYTGVLLEMGYEFVDLTSGGLCTTASSRHCFLKDGQITSLKRSLPELDAKIRAACEPESGS